MKKREHTGQFGNRILAIMLSVMLAAGSMPGTVFATEAEGTAAIEGSAAASVQEDAAGPDRQDGKNEEAQTGLTDDREDGAALFEDPEEKADQEEADPEETDQEETDQEETDQEENDPEEAGPADGGSDQAVTLDEEPEEDHGPGRSSDLNERADEGTGPEVIEEEITESEEREERSDATIDISSGYVFRIVEKTDADWIDLDNFQYSGEAITPHVEVIAEGYDPFEPMPQFDPDDPDPAPVRKYVLTEGTDFTVSFANNVNAGTATATATGIGDYTGSITRSFTIVKNDLHGNGRGPIPDGANPTVITSPTESTCPVGLQYDLQLVVKSRDAEAFVNPLICRTDGELTYTSDDTSVAAVDPSTGQVTVKGEGTARITAAAEEGTNYLAGSVSYALMVSDDAEEISEENCVGSGLFRDFEFWEVPDEEEAYWAVSSEGVLTIWSKGEIPGDECIEGPWYQQKKNINSISIVNSSAIPQYFFTVGGYGYENLTELTIEDGITSIGERSFQGMPYLRKILIPKSVRSIGDNSFLYCDNLVIHGYARSEAERYAGAAGIPFEKEQADIGTCTVTIPSGNYVYDGEDKEPAPVITDESYTLIRDTDYTVTYSDNRNAGTASVTVTGTGDYMGTATASFVIGKAEPALTFASAAVVKKRTDNAFTNELTMRTDGTVSFSSDNTAVAAVDSATGLVTVRGAGTAVITAAAAEAANYKAGSASYTLTVTSLDLEDLTYSFSNSAKSFGYPEGYVIPLSSYQVIFGDTTKAAWYYKTQNRWGGSCMGFSSTAALLYDPDNGLYPSGFNPGVSRIADLKVQDENSSIGLDIKRFIEAMQISQKTLQVKNTITSNRVYTSDIRKGNSSLNGFLSTVKEQTGAGIPVIIAVYQDGGHAILAYKTEDVSGTESRIYVYDNNYPLSERYITLNKDGAGNYTSWSYDMGGYGIWGTSDSGSSISCIPYSVIEFVWANRGDVNEIQNVVRFNSQNVALYDDNNKLAATVVDGELVTKDSRIRLIEDDLEAGGASDDGYTLLSMPIDVYTVKNLDTGTESLDLSIVDTNLGASVDTTAKEVTFIVDDSNDLNAIYIKAEEDDEYKIELNSSFEHGHDVEIEGCGSGETMEVSQESGYISINNCQIMNITVDGVEVKKYTVSASSGEGGSISPSGASTVIRDMDSVYTITPDSGYVIDDVKVDGKSVGAVTGYTFKQVRADHTISATFKKSVTLPGKTTRGDMFNLANNVKVTWKAVPGAKYYKVYREGITDPAETRKDPVIVTAGLVGWDKDPGLTNGHAYRYKIVASLTGKGDSSGDSKLAYSKVMYRLKTVVIRSVKNTAPGKVTVKYDRTTSGDSYVLQYCERQDMAGAKTKVVLGASNTSYVIGGLKKGKTYYISIRVRKKVNGIDYYTTFGVPKKVTVTK